MRLIATTTCLLLACGSTTAGPTTEAPIGNRVAPAPTDPPDGAAPAATGVSLTSVSPEQGDVNGGTYVVVRGRGFTTEVRDAKIYFGATAGTIIRFQSDAELIVQAPGGTLDDVVDVRVVLAPGGELVLPRAFRFVATKP